MTVIELGLTPPLDGLVRAITYQAGEQPQTSVERILPGPVASLWVNLNCDAFRSLSDDGRVRQVPGAMLAGPTSRACVIEYLRSRVNGPNHLRLPQAALA